MQVQTAKTLISPIVFEQINSIILSSQIEIIKDAYTHLHLDNNNPQDLQSFIFKTHLPFSCGKLTLNSPFKNSNHKLEFYFDINTLLEDNLIIFYEKVIHIELEFDVTLDPQTENELALLTLFNTAHYCYFFKEEYLLNIIGRKSDLHDEICKMIGVKMFEAVHK